MKQAFSRKLTALFLAVIMVVAMIPAMVLTTGAVEGDKYELVTDASQLEAGAKYLIGCPSKNMIMGAQSGKYRVGVGSTIANGEVAEPANAAVVTLGGADGAWTLQVSDGYLYWTSGNYVQTQDTAYEWTITLDGTTAVIASKATPARKLQWNASSPRFACYTSSQTAIALYKYVDENTGEGGHTHDWVETVTTPATCTTEGLLTKTCNNGCGETPTEPIEALGHEFDSAGACTRENCDVVAKLFEKVTDASTLQAGDKIIIVAANSAVAMGAQEKETNRPQATYATSGNYIITEGTDVLVLTLAAGTKEGTFAFCVEDLGYLYAGSTSSNHLKIGSDLTDDGAWLVEIDADGIATVKSQGLVGRNWIRYNKNSSIFSCYSSGQADIVIYKMTNPDAPTAPTATGFGLTLNKGVTVNVGYDISADWLALNPDAKVIFAVGEKILATLDATFVAQTYGITLMPMQINGELTATLVVGDEVVVATQDVSLAAYAGKVTALGAAGLKMTDEKYELLCNLIEYIGLYGDCADGSYTSDLLAGASIFDAVTGDITVDDTTAQIFGGGLAAVLDTQASAMIEINTEGKDLADYKLTVKLGTKTLRTNAVLAEYISEGDMLVINGLCPANFADEIVITITDAEGATVATASFTFNQYLKTVYNASAGNADVQNLAAAAYIYGAGALAYASAN